MNADLFVLRTYVPVPLLSLSYVYIIMVGYDRRMKYL